jgi:SAM-dependent methyltransferase
MEHINIRKTGSLSSSNFNHLHETHDASYDAPYLLPSDADEMKRLDFQHHILRILLKGNTLVPLDNPTSILDVGCGSSIWGVEMAQEFPAAQVIGLDLKQMVRPETPENYIFMQGNLLEGIPFPPNYFDFIHQRFLLYGVPTLAWPSVLQHLWHTLKPGGWIELIESGGEPFRPGGRACMKMFENILHIAATRNIDPRKMYNLGQLATNIGFTNVQTRNIEAPVGRWGGRVGTMMATDMLQGIRAFKEPCIKLLGYTALQFDDLCNSVSNEWEEFGSKYTFVAYTAQKPLSYPQHFV